MSDTKTLDLVVRRHSPFCACASNPSVGTVCSCFADEAAVELAQLRAELDEARKVIIELTHPLDYDQQFSHAHAWLSAHPEEK